MAASYSAEELARIASYEEALAVQLAAKPKRLEHSLSVASCAEDLALAYGLDPYPARVAGILHDWCKAYTAQEQAELCARYGVAFEAPLELLGPIMHGPLAAGMLPERFPELDGAVLAAIARHTVGDPDMGELDAVVFVADAIEPLRGDYPAAARLRAMAGNAPLAELAFAAVSESVRYVIETGRYLYPVAIETYNALALGAGLRKGDA